MRVRVDGPTEHFPALHMNEIHGHSPDRLITVFEIIGAPDKIRTNDLCLRRDHVGIKHAMILDHLLVDFTRL
jgi:hypothetical protein